MMKTSYDRLSRWYDALAGGSERRFVLAGLAQLRLQPGEHFLEIGPGTGHALRAAAQTVMPGGLAVGVDLSAGMLREARRRLGGRAGLVQGDGLRLPFAPGAWQAIFLSFTLELFSEAEMPVLLGECRRLLRPGGRLGVVALAESPQPGWMERLYVWTHTRFPQAVDCRPIRAAECLQAAGFLVETARRQRMWGLPVEMVVGHKEG